MTGNSVVLTGSLLSEENNLIHKNSKAAKFFKYNQEEFLQIKQMTELMPFSFHFIHPFLVANFIQNELSRPFKNFYIFNRESFCRLSSNYITPISFFLSPIFDYEQNYCMNIVLTKIETNAHYILFKDDGKIDGISDSLHEQCSLTGDESHLFFEQWHIFYLIPTLFETIDLEEKEGQITNKNSEIELLVNEKVVMFFPKKGNINQLPFQHLLNTLQRFIQNFQEAVESSSRKVSTKTSKKTGKSDQSQVEDKIEIPFFIPIENSQYMKTIYQYLQANSKRGNLIKYRAIIDLNMITYFVTSKMYTRYFVLRITELMEEDKLYNDIHLYSESLSKTKSATSHLSGKNITLSKTISPQSSDNKSFTSSNLKENAKKTKFQQNIQQQNQNELYLQTDPNQQKCTETQAHLLTNEYSHLVQINLTQVEQKGSEATQTIEDTQPNLNQEDGNLQKEQIIKSKYLQKKFHKETAKLTQTQNIESENDSKEHVNSHQQQAQIAASISSTTSHRSYTQDLIKEIIQSSSSPKLFKKIVSISIIQILFFICINVVLVCLINIKFNNFKTNINKMLKIQNLIQGISLTLFSVNLQYFENRGIIAELNDDTIQLIKNNYQISFDNINEFSHTMTFEGYESFYDLYSAYFFFNGVRSNSSISLEQLISQTADQLYLKIMDFEFDFDQFLFSQIYCWIGIYFLQLIMKSYLNKLKIKCMSLWPLARIIQTQFYLFIKSQALLEYNLVCFLIIFIKLIIAILLQFIIIPFYFNALSYQEKLLNLVGRLTEKDCISEIQVYESFMLNLSSKYDDYNLFSQKSTKQSISNQLISQLKQVIFSKEIIIFQNNQKNWKQASLFTQIREQKLKKNHVYIITLLSTVLVLLFFVIVLIYQTQIKNILSQSVNMNRLFASFNNAINYISCKQFSVISVTSPKIELLEYQTEGILDVIEVHFFKLYDELIDFELNHIKIFIISDYLSQANQDLFNKLFNNNVCDFPENADLFQCKDDYIYTYFQYGLIGGVSGEIKFVNEISKYMHDPYTITQEEVKYLYNNFFIV